jgi:hypothetical protein
MTTKYVYLLDKIEIPGLIAVEFPFVQTWEKSFGQGPQHTINLVGLCLHGMDLSVFRDNLVPSGTHWTDPNVSEYVSTISRCQILIYGMGNHWERMGGIFFTNYF